MTGNLTVNSTTNLKGVVNITAGRGTYGTGGELNIVGTGDLVYNTSALNFGGSGWVSHCFELSWQGFSHFMGASSTAAWYQTMMIEYTGAATGRWKFFNGLNVVGTAIATAFSSTSDSRLKTNIEEVPIEDSINLLRNVSAKTYNRINTENNKREIGFIAQDFENLPLSLGENFVDKIISKISPDGEDTELKTMAYDRVPTILWTVCKNLLARIEVLESKLNSN